MTGRIWTRLAVLVATLATVAVAATGAAAQPPVYAPSAVAKTCSSSYTHAIIGGAEKCLRAGEFCAHAYDSQYRHYGYRCTKYYANVQRYRLTRA
jgi:hypothetical protein